MADVDRTIGVGQGAGDQDLAGCLLHLLSAGLAENQELSHNGSLNKHGRGNSLKGVWPLKGYAEEVLVNSWFS
jgi:hypothetical protein